MAKLEIRDVCKRYDKNEVLKNVSLDCEDGGFLVLVGPSGCGKSTLLNIIAGLDHADSGEVRIGERRVNDVPARDRDIAMVFQSYALYPTMSVAENIAFALEMRKVPKAERERRVLEVARMLQIEALLARKPSQLSGGQRQRVAMGRALVRNPSVFLFDEPLSNLDAQLRTEMRTEIKKIHQRLGTTSVYVTHDQVEAMTLATKIAVMRDGRVVQVGSPSDLYEAPVDMFVAGFIGSGSVNFLSAQVVTKNGAPAYRVDRAAGSIEIPVEAESRARVGRLEGQAIQLGIRSEHLTEWRDGDSRLMPIECPVEVVQPTGADTWAILRLGGADVTARVSPGTPVKPGVTTRFALNVPRVMAFDPATQQRIG